MDKTLVCGTDAAGSIPAGSTYKISQQVCWEIL